MNRKMVFYMIGKIVQAEAAMLLLPLVVALLYKETPLPFLITIGIALVLGIALSLIFKFSGVSSMPPSITSFISFQRFSGSRATPFPNMFTTPFLKMPDGSR